MGGRTVEWFGARVGGVRLGGGGGSCGVRRKQILQLETQRIVWPRLNTSVAMVRPPALAGVSGKVHSKKGENQIRLECLMSFIRGVSLQPYFAMAFAQDTHEPVGEKVYPAYPGDGI